MALSDCICISWPTDSYYMRNTLCDRLLSELLVCFWQQQCDAIRWPKRDTKLARFISDRRISSPSRSLGWAVAASLDVVLGVRRDWQPSCTSRETKTDPRCSRTGCAHERGVTGRWSNYTMRSFITNYWNDQPKENETSEACGTHGRCEKWYSSWTLEGKRTHWETKASMGG
jgi:hypothetical protein